METQTHPPFCGKMGSSASETIWCVMSDVRFEYRLNSIGEGKEIISIRLDSQTASSSCNHQLELLWIVFNTCPNVCAGAESSLFFEARAR
jgi:hypothetical protein